MPYDRDFHKLTGVSDRYFDNLPLDYDESSVMEPQSSVPSDSDILPTCEYNMTEAKRKLTHFWTKRVYVRECEEVAVWMVFIDIEDCALNVDNPHDHIIMTCDEHKDSFDHKNVVHFACPSYGEPTMNYLVTRIEKI